MIVQADAVPDDLMGLDIGPQSIKSFVEAINNSATILWNGPMGVFEMSNFEAGTKAVAEAVAAVTQKGAFSLIGGGDSVAAINKYHLKDQVSYVSTGGGAMQYENRTNGDTPNGPTCCITQGFVSATIEVPDHGACRNNHNGVNQKDNKPTVVPFQTAIIRIT